MSRSILLSPSLFKELVMERDDGACVCCKKRATAVQHLLDTRLWEDGGHYLDNGASLCTEHRDALLKTTLSVELVRNAAGIKTPILPDSYSLDERYDCWGNSVRPSGVRYKGELFDEPDVQQWLTKGECLDDFSPYYKYPSTPHVPWSQGVQRDDRSLASDAHFIGQEVILTEKRDGENATLYADYYHARSLDGRHHPSRDWIKNFWGQIKHEIPVGWRICGENMFAKHSIGYDNLESYFEAFSIWNEKNVRISWDETVEYLDMLGIKPVPVIDRFIYTRDRAEGVVKELDLNRCEGYVMSLSRSFSYREFRHCVAKFVREGHVQTDKHWMNSAITSNRLITDIKKEGSLNKNRNNEPTANEP